MGWVDVLLLFAVTLLTAACIIAVRFDRITDLVGRPNAWKFLVFYALATDGFALAAVKVSLS